MRRLRTSEKPSPRAHIRGTYPTKTNAENGVADGGERDSGGRCNDAVFHRGLSIRHRDSAERIQVSARRFGFTIHDVGLSTIDTKDGQ